MSNGSLILVLEQKVKSSLVVLNIHEGGETKNRKAK